MRRVVVFAAALVALVAIPHEAHAEKHVKVDGVPFNRGAIRVDTSAPGTPSSGGKAPWSRGRRSTARLYHYHLPETRDGSYCLVAHYTRDQTRAALLEALGHDMGNILAGGYPPCRAAQSGARELAREFWDERELPSPTLRAAPGWAITGKPVYLEILGERERTFEVDNPIGPDVVIHATSEYVVDWGDPYDATVTRTSSPGGPWPHGELTHVYTDVGNVTITVTQQWKATWTAGQEEGTLDSLRTEGRLPDFRIVQLQAVRRR